MNATVALVGARAARGLDEDMEPLVAALVDRGVRPQVVEWDDRSVEWAAFDAALLRSTWDYCERLGEFRAWMEQVSRLTRLHNPHALVEWNTDKHYLRDLAALDVPTVPSAFIEPGEMPDRAIEAFLDAQPCAEFVVKPAVGAGSRGVRRLARAETEQATAHARELLRSGRSVLLQPYLSGVDRDGETALIYFGGQFSHAVCKGPILRPGENPTEALFAPEHISARAAREAQLRIGSQALEALALGGRAPSPPLYARVDLLCDERGAARVLELELAEPSLFLTFAPGAALRFADQVVRAIGD